MSVKVKICGLTRYEDVQTAFEAGSDFFGIVVEVQGSPRSVGRKRAKILLDEMVLPSVVVTRSKSIDELVELGNFLSPHALQLHGDETPDLVTSLRVRINCRIWKAIPLPTTREQTKLFQNLLVQSQNFVKAGCDALVLDTATNQGFGGMGVVGSWELAAELVKRLDFPCFLAGGLTPDNVLEAIEIVRPFGVDVSSGVESSPGVKDPEKIRLFCRRAKQMSHPRFSTGLQGEADDQAFLDST